MVPATLHDGNPVMIQPANIAYVQPADDGALIVFSGGACLTVKEAFDDVLHAIAADVAAD